MNTRREWLLKQVLTAAGMSGALVAVAQEKPGTNSDVQSLSLDVPGFQHRTVRANDIDIHCVVAGSGPAVLLLHGWPFTWYTWHRVIPALASTHTVIAPDLRGIGSTAKPVDGYDVGTLAEDAMALLTQLGVRSAAVVGHDLGVGVAFQLAARHPQLVRRLVVMESIVLGAPHAERFMATPPWWVAFHNVRDLPETVLLGHEASYLDWFYTQLSFERRGISPQSREAQVWGYLGKEALRGGFEHYRAFGQTTRQGRAASMKRLRMPVLALGGELVRDILLRQMKAVADDVQGGVIPRCGHIIQEERPDEFLRRFFAFV